VAWLADSKLAADEVEFEDSRWQGVEEEILCRDDTGRAVNDIAIREGGMLQMRGVRSTVGRAQG
jgi:hypothetical protein